MRKISTIYLAGPESWLPEPAGQALGQRALCEAAGFVGLTPADAAEATSEASEIAARQIYAARHALMRRADAGIVNLTPWRGPSCDTGAAYEAGFLAALGKPIFAYLNIADEADAEYRDRVEAVVGATLDEDGVWRDEEGCTVENLGLPETIMLWAEARRLYVIVTPDPMGDLTGLQLCLDAVREYES